LIKRVNPNPVGKKLKNTAVTIEVSEFLANLQRSVGVDTRPRSQNPSDPQDPGCATYIRAGILSVYGGSHDIYFGGMNPMFDKNMIFSGKIADLGGVDGLIPGMILSSKDNAHGGVYAGLRDFGDGKEPVPAVYQFKGEKGVLGRYSDSKPGFWVNYGWHVGVVLF
jgi:hypothetical protein